jgi:hypothetical protein
MFGIEKDFQQLMEQVYGPHYGLGRKVEEESARIAKQLVDNAVEEAKKMDEPVQYETPMTEIEDIEAQIKVLQSKLEFYKELERTKTPCEEAYKRVYGNYPVTDIADTCWSGSTWTDFATGYDAAQKDYKVGEFQEPAKDVVSLYERFVNEGAYGMISFENALRVVNDFLLDEGVIEDESGEYITFTLQKSLLEIPND